MTRESASTSGVIARYPGLVCPRCHGRLSEDECGLDCLSCAEHYALLDGEFPIMLPGPQRAPSPDEVVQDRVAAVYEHERYGHPNARVYHDWWFRLMLSRVPAHGLVLDVGCATGQLFEHLPAERVIGLDLSPEMIRRAGRRSNRVMVGDVFQLPFGDESFDTVLLRGLLHHLPDLDRGIAELRRVLRPGGVLVATETHRSLLSAIPRALATHTERFSEDHQNLSRSRLVGALSRHFEIEHTSCFGYLAYPLLGFPDAVPLTRRLPRGNWFTQTLIRLDGVLSRTPLLRRLGWAVFVQGRRRAPAIDVVPHGGPRNPLREHTQRLPTTTSAKPSECLACAESSG